LAVLFAYLPTAGVVVSECIIVVDNVRPVIPAYRLNPELAGGIIAHVFNVQ
jgi:hypothetical protein